MRALTGLLISFLLFGCASAIPTHYYSLSAGHLEDNYALNEQVSLGVLAVSISDQLKRDGLVSRKGANELEVSSYHIWAGDLDDNISGFLVDVLAQRLSLNDVRSAPWNKRLRPEYQVEINIDQFSGEIGGKAVIKASYSLLSDKGQKHLLTRRFSASVNASVGYRGYVDSLNELLLEFSGELAKELQSKLSK